MISMSNCERNGSVSGHCRLALPPYTQMELQCTPHLRFHRAGEPRAFGICGGLGVALHCSCAPELSTLYPRIPESRDKLHFPEASASAILLPSPAPPPVSFTWPRGVCGAICCSGLAPPSESPCVVTASFHEAWRELGGGEPPGWRTRRPVATPVWAAMSHWSPFWSFLWGSGN